jgi:integrase
MFNLAKRWGTIVADNPVAGVRMFREEKRDRFLNPDELKRTLAAVDEEADWRWKAYFKLSLLLGPRRSELLSARWVDIDLESCTWRLPTTKAGRSHLLPLPTPALAILESLPSRGNSDWLFPSTTAASGTSRSRRKPGSASGGRLTSRMFGSTTSAARWDPGWRPTIMVFR